MTENQYNIEAIDAAYAAGLFDGEGHIGVRYKSNKNCINPKYKYPNYYLVVTLAQIELAAVNWLHKIFGGSKTWSVTKRSDSDVKFLKATWTLSARQARDFLLIVKPYLKLKDREADIAVSFQNSMGNYGRSGVPNNILQFREKCLNEILEIRRKKREFSRAVNK